MQIAPRVCVGGGLSWNMQEKDDTLLSSDKVLSTVWQDDLYSTFGKERSKEISISGVNLYYTAWEFQLAGWNSHQVNFLTTF